MTLSSVDVRKALNSYVFGFFEQLFVHFFPWPSDPLLVQDRSRCSQVASHELCEFADGQAGVFREAELKIYNYM